jgi:uncharacterized protein (DUF1015 family)
LARVFPFRGVRYNRAMVPDLAAVVTPPYDVIGPEDQHRYYQLNPYNSIRLECGYQYPDDNQGNNRYTRAAADYGQWLRQGVLVQEEEAAIYLYEQLFRSGGERYRRTGFFARLGLEGYDSGRIRPHEETLAKPKADRLALMEACGTNFSSIFACYHDPGQLLESDFAGIKQQPPQVELTDEAGEQHRLWVVTDRQLQRQAADLLAGQELFIADGHHRYETALNFYRQHGADYPAAGSIMAYLVNTSDPGLVILPTHRILHHLERYNRQQLLTGLEQSFTVTELPYPAPAQIPPLLQPHKSAGETAFVLCDRQQAWLLVLRDKQPMRQLNPGYSADWCALDVSVLQSLIFEQLLGIKAEEIAQQTNLSYTRSEGEALQMLQEEQGQLAFFLNPTGILEIAAVAAAGEKMPQKSTFFYPKLLTGLVFNDLHS